MDMFEYVLLHPSEGFWEI